MYSRCHICRADLGANDAIPHMPVGDRLAYDIARGRLWVVCPRCREWNLTPMEERWEAIEECERLFADGEARASTANVGVSRARGIVLIRIGPALRDELANWRYGPRFERRRHRSGLVVGTAATLGVAGVGAAALAGSLAAGAAVGLYGAARVGLWAHAAIKGLSREISPGRAVHVVDSKGRGIRIPSMALTHVHFVRRRSRGGGATKLQLRLSRESGAPRVDGNEALRALAAILPRMNWRGGRSLVIDMATQMLTEAEHAIAKRTNQGPRAALVWEWIALGNWPRDGIILEMPLISRLALEMAVTEELERQAMAGEARSLGEQWLDAEEVAAIADDMFIPDRIVQWIKAQRGSRLVGQD